MQDESQTREVANFDGKRILMGQLAGFSGTAGGGATAIGPDPGRPYIAVAMNWAASLKK